MKTLRSISCLLLFALLCLSLNVWGQGAVATCGEGRKYALNDVTVVRLKGTWYEMGRQYGKLLSAEMRRTLAFASKQANAESDAFLLPDGIPCGIDFLDQLFAGVSAGSGLSFDEIRRLTGVELAYIDVTLQTVETTPSQCTTLALYGGKSRGGRTLMGRNYDWMASFDVLDTVLAYFQPTDGSLGVAMLNYAGCLYLTTGMNDAGLFAELNSGAYASDENHEGVYHNAWTMWLMLRQSRTVHQAAKFLNTLTGQNFYIIGLADPKECAFVEWAVGKATKLQEPAEVGYMVEANHFVQPGWKNLPGVTDYGPESSLARREAMLKLAGKVEAGSGTLATMKSLFAVGVADGGATCTDTLFQAIADPAGKALLVRNRKSDGWVRFAFDVEVPAVEK